MSCTTFKDDRFIWQANGTTFSVVADQTARDAISSPSAGDGAWLKNPGRYDTYNGASWDADQTAFPITDFSLSKSFDDTDTTDSESEGTSKDIITVRSEDTLSTTGIIYSGAEGISGKAIGFTFSGVSYATTDVSYTRTYDTVNCTSSEDTAPNKSFTWDRYEANGSATINIKAGTAAPVAGSQQTAEVKFDGDNVKAGGLMEITSIESAGTRGDRDVYNIDFRVIGEVTETGITDQYENEGVGGLILAPTQGYEFTKIFKESLSFTANVGGDATRTDTWRINDGYTEFTA